MATGLDTTDIDRSIENITAKFLTQQKIETFENVLFFDKSILFFVSKFLI